jgi:hypothetical protein
MRMPIEPFDEEAFFNIRVSDLDPKVAVEALLANRREDR